MSAKRQATTDLNHDNWDQEDDEPEESEGFKIASKEVLEKRVIRTAKRRSNVTSEGQKSVFSGFGGFNKTQKTSFDFLANLTNGKSTNTGVSNQEGSSLFSSKTFSNQSTALFTPSDISNNITNTDDKNQEGSSSPFTSKTFTNSSKGLFTPSDVSKPTSSLIKSTVAGSQTDFKNSESPFKSHTTSSPITNFNFSPKPNSGNIGNPVSQTTNNIFSDQAENIFSKKSFKMSPSSNTLSASPSNKCQSIEETKKEEKKDTVDESKFITIKCDANTIDGKTLKYYKYLAGLNISLSEWIKKNIDDSPVCILSPIFKDYEKHLKEIQDEYFNRDGAQGDFAQNLKSNPKVPSTAQANNVAVTSNNSTSSTTEEKKSLSMVFGTPASNNKQAKDTGSLFGNVPKVQSFTSSNTAAQAKDMGSVFGNVPKVQSSTTSLSSAAQASNILSQSSVSSHVSTILTPDEKKSSSMIFGTPTTNNTQGKNMGSLFGNVAKAQSFTSSSSTQASNILSHTSVTSNESTSSTPEEKKSSHMVFGTPASNNTPAKDMGSLFGKVQSPTTSSSTAQNPKLGFSFGISSVAGSTPVTSSGGFTFGINNSSQTTSLFATKPIVSNINGNSQFSFGAGKPFSFNSNIQRKDESNEDTKTKEDEDEPPKVEYTPMVEENSVFDRKCKIFVKKDGNFVDKGVGTLYIKTIEDSKKHQLLVRANTSLGNILLNLVLATSVPTQRMGKNNVMLVCIPTPDAKPPPTPVLIRVKTSEEADELLEKLNNYKQ
ncbi:nuclear pore complex protein Nup50 isoform X2 [Pieris brassicae]|uniref:nuclear pore complex protein Nup50 isoform X2 n=1 Tax=Pieris brassicae TaxID=7116 RepID=UPI001E662994|nr:nuclear pore complex protein Nup50 isoform X2 [Pieris brassicae]